MNDKIDHERAAKEAALMPRDSKYNQLSMDPQTQKMLAVMAAVLGGINAMGAVGGGSQALRGFSGLNPGRLPGAPGYPSAPVKTEAATPWPIWNRGPISNAGPAAANLKGMGQGVPQLVPMRRGAQFDPGTPGEGDREMWGLIDFARGVEGMKNEPGAAFYRRMAPSGGRPF